MKKILCSLFYALPLFGMAQNVELIQSEVRQTAYQSKSYYVVQSLTIQPPSGGGSFYVNASTNGNFFISPASAAASSASNVPPSTNQNFTRTEVILTGGITQENQIPVLSVNQKSVSYDYTDGVGRPTMSSNVMGSPAQNDLINPFYYNPTDGWPEKKYLPFASTSTKDGSFHSGAISEQTSFYGNAAKVAADGTSYSKLTFEKSALGRVMQVTGPGDLWNNKSTTATVSTNLANTILFWQINSTTGLPYTSSASFYAAGTLIINSKVDEDGNQVSTYQNLRGQVVLKSYNNTLNTTYVYDDYGNIRYVITPQAPLNYTPDQNYLNVWAYEYQYDLRQRLVKKRNPGTDIPATDPESRWVYNIYDNWDRLVLTQDGNQRLQKWTFIKYDQFNRPVVTGIYQNTATYAQMVTNYTNYYNANPSTSHHEGRSNTGTGTIGYTLNATFPNTVAESDIQTIQYFDDYTFTSIASWDILNNNYSVDPSVTSNSTYLSSVLGQMTGSKIKIQGPNTWLNSVTYYDKLYRPLETLTQNHLGGIDKIFNAYNFAGWLTQTKRVHTSSSGSVTTVENFDYDHRGRLLHHWHQADSNPMVLLSSNNYNEAGQLVESNLHSSDNGTTFLQSVDYRYNIRGWLTSINNSTLTADATNDDTNDLFGMKMYYNQESVDQFNTVNTTNTDPSYKASTNPLYNGRITATRWKTNNLNPNYPPTERAFAFSYDGLSRIQTARYGANNGTSFSAEPGYYDMENLNYDNNGNIMSLRRYTGATGSRTPLDDLTYSYGANNVNGNELQSITDAASTFGFRDGFTSPTEMTYDKNGNTTTELNQWATSVTYNNLNLPSQIFIDLPNTTNDYTITMTYDATGALLSKVWKQGTTVMKQIDYIHGIQYLNGQLSNIRTPYGRAMKNGTNYEYAYNLKDNLGNTRLTFGQLHETDTYLATMEPTNANQEVNQYQFNNISGFNVGPGLNHTAPTVVLTNPNYTAIVQKNGAHVGPSKLLQVKQGESVSMQVYANSISGINGNGALVSGMAALVANSFTSVVGETLAGTQALQNQSGALLGGIPLSSTTVPKAYLCYILFNSTFTSSQFGYQSIDNSAFNAWEQLSVNMTAPYDGSLYIFTANESTVSECYFDDLLIVHNRVNMGLQVTESADYDPFGYIFDGTHFVNTGVLSNYNLYQGENSEFDPISGWNRFSSRGNYDSRIGRWYSPDPGNQYASQYVGMGNSPINGVDPDGQFFELLLEAAVEETAAFSMPAYAAAMAESAAAAQMAEIISAGVYAGIANVGAHADQVQKDPAEALGYFGAGFLGGASSVYLGGVFGDAGIGTGLLGKVSYGGLAGFAIGGLANVGVDNMYGNINGWDWRSFSLGGASMVNAKHDVDEIAGNNGITSFGEAEDDGLEGAYHDFLRSGFQNLAKGFGSSKELYRSGLIDFTTGGLTSIPNKGGACDNCLSIGYSLGGNFAINYFNEYLSNQIKSTYFGKDIGNPMRDAAFDALGDSSMKLFFNLSAMRYGLLIH